MSLNSARSYVTVTEEQGCIRVRFLNCTTITEANVEEIGRQLNALVGQREQPHLSVDLSNIDLLTSMALAKLISLNGRVRARGGQLKLINPKPVVREVFAITQLTRILDVQDIPETLSA
jgi:anti-sigma B factor antagonist